MPFVKNAAVAVALAAVGLQWIDQQANPTSLANGFFAPWLHAARLTRFYQRHAPEKIAGVPGVLESYKGREDVLYGKLAKKYGVDAATAFRVDALSAARAGVEAVAHGVGKSPAAAEVVGRWRGASPGEKATRAAFATALLAYLAAPPPGSPRDRVRSLCYLGPVAVAAIYGPSPASFSLKAIVETITELVRANDVRGRLMGVGAATAFAATLRPRAGPVVALGVLAAALASNPGLDASGVMDAALLHAAGVATRRDAAKAVAAAPGDLRLHDLSVLSVVVYAPTDTWAAPVLAVGGFGAWFPLGSVSARGEGELVVDAQTFPLYLVAAGLAFVAWAAFGYVDAVPSVQL